MPALTVIITVVAVVLFGAFILVGAWIDGRRQKLLDAGKHPVTTASGDVVARESQENP